MAKVYIITFLISCEYVSVNWTDLYLKNETCHVVSHLTLVLIIQLVCLPL